MRKIALVVATMQGGGAERVMAGMANYWNRHNWEVSVITVSGVEEDFYELDREIDRIGLNELRPSRNILDAVFANLTRIKKLHAVLRKVEPEIVISFLDTTNIQTLLAALPLKLPVIVSERVDVTAYQALHPVWKWLRRKVYKTADIVVVQTNNQLKLFKNILQDVRVEVIPNPLFTSIKKGADEFVYPNTDKNKRNVILGMGRLVNQKGFDLLIEAFYIVHKDNQNWLLYIFGEGPERLRLEKLIRDLGLENSVFLPGRISNTEEVLAWADIFVLSSRYEGFPNVLLEAMAQHTPPVSFDCPSGPADIIKDGVSGRLVAANDVNSMARAILELIDDEPARIAMGEKAKNTSENYEEQKVMAVWERIIDEVIQNAAGMVIKERDLRSH